MNERYSPHLWREQVAILLGSVLLQRRVSRELADCLFEHLLRRMRIVSSHCQLHEQADSLVEHSDDATSSIDGSRGDSTRSDADGAALPYQPPAASLAAVRKDADRHGLL